MRFRIPFVLSNLLLASAALGGLPPVSGVPVSELSWATSEMRSFMDQFGISGGLLAIMKDGRVVYQRGFGWHDSGENVLMPENALVRIASCTKPITAAAVRRLDAAGAFGVAGLDRLAFNLGQTPTPGVLNITPWPSLGDSRLRNVTIRHLLEHKGGWDRSITDDVTYRECEIAGDMGVNSPPGRTNTLRWILGRPLEFAPGTDQAYSNVGYLALGLIVEQVSGQSLINNLRSNVLTANDWVPASDFLMGRTFEANQPVREAWYDDGFDTCVFTNGCLIGCGTPINNGAYGSWDHEARTGQGAVVLNPATMLEFLERYRVQSSSANIGLPLNGSHVNGAHNGALGGVNSYAWQRSDGVNVFIWFNQRASGDGDPDDPSHYGSAFRTIIDPYLNSQASWPGTPVDGFWVEPATSPFVELFGSYNEPFHGLGNAMSVVSDGSKLNLKPGDSTWTGVVDKKVLIRAPLGAARVGAS